MGLIAAIYFFICRRRGGKDKSEPAGETGSPNETNEFRKPELDGQGKSELDAQGTASPGHEIDGREVEPIYHEMTEEGINVFELPTAANSPREIG
jgi:hypothetical protein